MYIARQALSSVCPCLSYHVFTVIAPIVQVEAHLVQKSVQVNNCTEYYYDCIFFVNFLLFVTCTCIYTIYYIHTIAYAAHVLCTRFYMLVFPKLSCSLINANP